MEMKSLNLPVVINSGQARDMWTPRSPLLPPRCPRLVQRSPHKGLAAGRELWPHLGISHWSGRRLSHRNLERQRNQRLTTRN